MHTLAMACACLLTLGFVRTQELGGLARLALYRDMEHRARALQRLVMPTFIPHWHSLRH